MDLHNRFAKAHEFPGPEDMHPRDYYIKCLVSSLYTVGRVSNTPSPIPLPNWDDYADLENIRLALTILMDDVQGMMDAIDPPEPRKGGVPALLDDITDEISTFQSESNEEDLEIITGLHKIIQEILKQQKS